MIEKHINKLNNNPFFGGIIMQAFHAGYNSKECPLLLHYIILPMILYGDLRNSLLFISKDTTLTNFTLQNKIHLIGFQDNVWMLKALSNQSLIVLHNKKTIVLKEQVEVVETINYNNYNDDVKKYLRAATYLGIMLKKESVLDIFKILKTIP